MAKKKLAKADAPVVQEANPVPTGPPVIIGGNVVTASSVQVLWAGNDCTLVFNRFRPAELPNQPGTHVGVSEPVALIQLSTATMKDLSVIMAEVMTQYEKDFGAVETTFTRSRQTKKKTPTKH